MKVRWMQGISGLLLVVSLSGCAGILIGGAATGISLAHDRRTAGTVIDDQSIELKLYDNLNRELPPGNRISITSYNGTVLLTGEVVSDGVRGQAEQIVRAFNEPPVRTVHNELVIGPPSSLSVQSSDTLVTTPDFDPTRVKVVTDRGVVYLLGLVRPIEADAAADVASQVGGVQQVVTLFEYIN